MPPLPILRRKVERGTWKLAEGLFVSFAASVLVAAICPSLNRPSRPAVDAGKAIGPAVDTLATARIAKPTEHEPDPPLRFDPIPAAPHPQTLTVVRMAPRPSHRPHTTVIRLAAEPARQVVQAPAELAKVPPKASPQPPSAFATAGQIAAFPVTYSWRLAANTSELLWQATSAVVP